MTTFSSAPFKSSSIRPRDPAEIAAAHTDLLPRLATLPIRLADPPESRSKLKRAVEVLRKTTQVYITDLRRAGLRGRKEDVLAEAAWLDAQGELLRPSSGGILGHVAELTERHESLECGVILNEGDSGRRR